MSGTIGIGTTSTYSLTHITGNSTGTISLLIANTNTTVNSAAAINFGLWGLSGSGTSTSSPAAQISAIVRDANGGNTDLAFSTYTGILTAPTIYTLSERMRITAGGNVGIGVTNPDVALSVNGSIRCNSTGIIYLNAGGSTAGPDNSLLGRLYFVDSAGYAYPGASIEAYGMGTTGPGFGAELRFNTNAYSFGGTQTRLKIGITGTIYFSAYNTNGTVITSGSNGTLAVSSDSRIKNTITYITDTTSALTQINNLKPATFCMNGAPDIHLGFIAQDVEQHIPLAVDGKKHEYQWEVDADGKPVVDENGQLVYRVDQDGNKIIRPRGLSDRAIIATQTLAIQELTKQLSSQQTQIDTLIQRLAAANIA